MNIKLLYSWILKYLDTNISPYDFKKCFSLCGASVEKVEKAGKDYILDIEITTNRIDMASVVGIAREAGAILPRFGIKAKFKPPVLKSVKFPDKNRLNVLITDKQKLCRRVLGVILDNVKLGSSPKKVKTKLEAAGIRSLNNAVDVTNLVMTEIGHPAHVFDYDRIKTKKLILRKAKKGETIVSLENKKYLLAGGDIVIDDGIGNIIDLPGIIGTKNSIVTPNTKRVLLFLETNDPVQIRKSSMGLGIRTVAASYNEKWVDPELGLTALKRGVQLLQQLTGAKVASQIYDLYPKPWKPKNVSLDIKRACQFIGVKIKSNEIENILESLQFKKIKKTQNKIIVQVPSFRDHDVNIEEDLIEEVARMYGYHNIPSTIPPLSEKYGLAGKANPQTKMFKLENKIKHLLASLGFTETYSYSLVSKKLIENCNLDITDHLKLANPLSLDWQYLRTNLIPSMLDILSLNKEQDKIDIFELSNIYLPGKINQIPLEKPKLVIVSNYKSFSQIKGIAQTILDNLNITNCQIVNSQNKLFNLNHQMEILYNKSSLGYVGCLNSRILKSFDINKQIIVVYLDFDNLVKYSLSYKPFKMPPKYPPVIQDLTLVVKNKITCFKILNKIKKISPKISKIEFIGKYKNNLTLRLYFLSKRKSLSLKEVEKLRIKIIQTLQGLGWAKLKQKERE